MKNLIILTLFLQIFAFASIAPVKSTDNFCWTKSFNDDWDLSKPAGYKAQGVVEPGRSCIQINTLKQPHNEWAAAKTTFDGETGSYSIILTSLQETDGECSYRVLVDGVIVMEYNNPKIFNTTTKDYAPYTAGVKGIKVRKGVEIQVNYRSHSNGLIPEHDAFAWARGRWRSISIGNCNSVSVDKWIENTPKTKSKNAKTVVSIQGEMFYINGKPTYEGVNWNGNKIEGLLMNSRMVQGIFDDLNPETVGNWKYPDTQKWDPDRNTNEFVAAMDEWYAKGLIAFTINLQGGSPMGYGNKGWINSAMENNGNLRPEYMARLKKILDRADEKGMVVILGLFYFGQEKYMDSEAAVYKGVDNTMEWLFSNNYKNVLIEVVNETGPKNYKHRILQIDSIHHMIDYIKAKEKNGFRYLVSTSYRGAAIPGEEVVKTSDYILLHGNDVNDPAGIIKQIEATKALKNYTPKPIVYNEDDHFDFDKPSNNFVEALKAYTSWGYFDYRATKGTRGSAIDEPFNEGFQSIPIDWGINSDRKRGFFKLLEEITGGLK